jgi:hypothetical protein
VDLFAAAAGRRPETIVAQKDCRSIYDGIKTPEHPTTIISSHGQVDNVYFILLLLPPQRLPAVLFSAQFLPDARCSAVSLARQPQK